MESCDGVEEDLVRKEGRDTTFHLRLAAICVVLVGLACVQDAGLLVADTKFDLVIDPGGFLARALHLWDEQGAFGQLQNQAYGYLWPMGPFFALGDLINLPGWLIQRLWIAVIMSVAFVGAAKLIKALGVRSDAAAIIAALAYALSPRMLTTLGPTSIEAWPSALAPWVLLPLVIGAKRGSPRRAAALAALAVAMVGGVNAAATFAVLPVGMIWLLTRTPGARRRSMLIWWPVFTLLGTLWWLVPLFALGAYSPPFLEYIESASVTTIPTNLFDAWRGTSDWVAYVSSHWRAGHDLVTTSYGPLNSAVLLVFGSVGLMLRRNPHRQFLALSLLAGLLMVTFGHAAQLPGWFASDQQAALDGALSALRNVHKFDPVIRIPMTVGLAWVLECRLRPANSPGFRSTAHRVNQMAFAGIAVIALIGSMIPILAGRLTPMNASLGVPDYWYQSAAWLKEHSGQETALLVPGSSFADYIWGAPKDEPMQALAASRWAVRNAIPLTPPGTIRMLDAIEQQISQGHGSAAWSSYLARAGVRYLVVRNDLQPSQDVTTPAVVHQAISQSPGITRIASFGPPLGGAAHLTKDGKRILINGGAQAEWPAVEIYGVSGSAPAVVSDTTPVVVGGPEDVLGLIDRGVIGDAPVQLAADRTGAPAPNTPVVLTDGLQVRERFFGRINDGYSAVMTPGERRRSGNPMRDYTIDDGDRWGTWAKVGGVDRISASSSMSDSGAWGGSRPASLPYAAIDADSGTSWTSGGFQNAQAWWRVDLSEQRDIQTIEVTAGGETAERQRLRVVTDSTRSESFLLSGGETIRIPVNADRAQWLRIENAGNPSSGQISLAEVRVDGLDVSRSLVLPTLDDGWPTPDVISLRRLGDARTGCIEVGGDIRCLHAWERDGEEANGFNREFWLPSPVSMEPGLRVRPKSGDALDELIQQDQPINIKASSIGVRDVRASALAAIDGIAGTTWSAEIDDLRPHLELNWLGRTKISGLDVQVDPDAPVRRPTKVTLAWPKGERTVLLGESGRVRFPPITTDRIRISVLAAEESVSVGFDRGITALPIGVSELRLTGLALLPLIPENRPRVLPCGSGPSITVAGHTSRTRIAGSAAQFGRGEELNAEVCDAKTLRMEQGHRAVEVTDSEAFAAQSLVLTNPRSQTQQTAETLGVVAPSPIIRHVAPSRNGVLALRENTNPGWRAQQGANALEPVTLDGWQQGWRLKGEGPATVRFGPDTIYRAGLVVGGGFWLLLLALALWSRRWRSGMNARCSEPRELPAALLIGVGVVAAGFLAGTVGVVVVAAGAVMASIAEWRHEEWGAWLTSSMLLVASFAWVFGPWGGAVGWGGNDEWPLYPTLLALGGIVAAVFGFRRPRLRNRMKGSSITR